VKILSVKANNRRRAFEVHVAGRMFPMPYARVEPTPSPEDPIVELFVDDELGREGFTWVLRSGQEGSLHIDSVREHNQVPNYMRRLLLYNLTVEAINCVQSSGLSKREIMRRAGTSPAQFYRLLDPTNTTKTVDGLLRLFSAVDCDVDFSVRPYSQPLNSNK